MKSAFKLRPPRYPRVWQELPAGELIQAATQSVCDELSQRVFGYHFVKLGNLSSQIALPHCAVKHHIHQCKTLNPKADLVADSHVLPFVENSVDGFLLANELDFAQDPHEILREVDRTITGSGYVIISGFNPYSLTGLGKYLPIKRDNILHDARFFPAGRVRDWLQLLGYEIIEQRHLMFSMLFFTGKLQLPNKVRDWLSRHCPWCSSMYVILARKRTFPMTTVKPKWKLKPRFSPVGASMRESTK